MISKEIFLKTVLAIMIIAIVGCGKQRQPNVVKNYVFTDSCDEAGGVFDPSTGTIPYSSVCGPYFLSASITFLEDTNRIIFLNDTFRKSSPPNVYWKYIALHYDHLIILNGDSIFHIIQKGGSPSGYYHHWRARGKMQP